AARVLHRALPDAGPPGLPSRRACEVRVRGDAQEGEAAPSHWTMSSARLTRDCGIVIPSALAVLPLMTSSNFVGCSTGSSLGLAPFRILSTYVAARRPPSVWLGP